MLHALNRLAFGPRPGDAQWILGARRLDAIFPGYGERKSDWIGLL